MKLKRVEIQIQEQLYGLLLQVCQQEHKSISAIIRELIVKKVKTLKHIEAIEK